MPAPDSGTNRQGGLQGNDVAQMTGGGMAVQGQPNAHEVVVQLSVEQGPCRVGQMAGDAGTRLGQSREHAHEALLLEAGQGIVRLIGTGQMAVDALQIEVFQALQLRRGLMSLAEGAAQPCHAGVDLQLHVETPAAVGCQSVAELGIPEAAQGGHQPPVQASAQVVRFIDCLLYTSDAADD